MAWLDTRGFVQDFDARNLSRARECVLAFAALPAGLLFLQSQRIRDYRALHHLKLYFSGCAFGLLWWFGSLVALIVAGAAGIEPDGRPFFVELLLAGLAALPINFVLLKLLYPNDNTDLRN